MQLSMHESYSNKIRAVLFPRIHCMHISHLQWILPPYLTELLFLSCAVGIIAFGFVCGDVVDPEKYPWTAGIAIVCDVLPV